MASIKATVFIEQELLNIKVGDPLLYQVNCNNRRIRLFFFLICNDPLIRQLVHLIQEIARRNIYLFNISRIKYIFPQQQPIPVHSEPLWDSDVPGKGVMPQFGRHKAKVLIPGLTEFFSEIRIR